MDRIVIIGNGFDKAHGLKTGYGDFMDYIRDSIVNYIDFGDSKRLDIKGVKCKEKSDYYHRMNEEGRQDKWIAVNLNRQSGKFKLTSNHKSKSMYFSSLFKENEKLGQWSDLESHYFNILIENKENKENITLINEEFDHLKLLLKEYLTQEIEDKISVEEFNFSNDIYETLKKGKDEFDFDTTCFVSFNYTSKLLNNYFSRLNSSKREKFPKSPIQIHGTLKDSRNPIIFGYGDENSNDYKDLEKLGNNELLKNFKTFQYLTSNKYREVLGLLESSSEIYIQIVGHSCGLCDKALLRNIFQHDNVKFIESIYYQDNSRYFENLYNISRIFDDNTLMRKKLIPLEDTIMIKNNPLNF